MRTVADTFTHVTAPGAHDPVTGATTVLLAGVTGPLEPGNVLKFDYVPSLVFA